MTLDSLEAKRMDADTSAKKRIVACVRCGIGCGIGAAGGYEWLRETRVRASAGKREQRSRGQKNECVRE